VKTNQEHIDELIGKYLAGEAAQEEIVFVEQWAKESDQNQFYLNHFKTIFEKAAAGKDLQLFDTDAAWIKLSESLNKPNGKVVALEGTRSSTLMWTWRIAASIILVLGIGFYLYTSRDSETAQPVMVIAGRQTISDTLPDGSNVFLNKATKLAYSFNNESKEHRVTLEGEAYFNILHDENKKFVIDIAGIYIRDIGTSFNVKAYPDSNSVEVVVEKGEVMFYTKNDSGVYLKANGKGVYNKITKSFTIDQPEANVLAYKTKLFSFSDTNLAAVVRELNRVYDKQIVLPANLRNCRLTVSFNNESQDEMINVIAETLGLTVNRAGDMIMLEGVSCEP
jgi:transmembrane sensor